MIFERCCMRAPRETVWAALTEDEMRDEWWSYLELEAQPGGCFHETWTDEQGRPKVTRGRIIEADPPSILRMTWADDDWAAETGVTITLTQAPGGTEVRVMHDGWEATRQSDDVIDAHRAGWQHHLSELRTYAESLARSGDASPRP